MARERQLKLVVRRRSTRDVVTSSTRFADPDDTGAMQQALREILRAGRWDEDRFSEFDLDVNDAAGSLIHIVTTSGVRQHR